MNRQITGEPRSKEKKEEEEEKKEESVWQEPELREKRKESEMGWVN
jgi:hypothetical protein